MFDHGIPIFKVRENLLQVPGVFETGVYIESVKIKSYEM